MSNLKRKLDDAPVFDLSKVSIKKTRCEFGDCKAKLGLTSAPCKCGSSYCSLHRHCESHNCAYDFHGIQKTELTKKLVKVVGDSLENRI
jgi:hypothetical protein